MLFCYLYVFFGEVSLAYFLIRLFVSFLLSFKISLYTLDRLFFNVNISLIVDSLMCISCYVALLEII